MARFSRVNALQNAQSAKVGQRDLQPELVSTYSFDLFASLFQRHVARNEVFGRSRLSLPLDLCHLDCLYLCNLSCRPEPFSF